MNIYNDYILGRNMDNRLPFSMKVPDGIKKVTLNDLMNAMGHHFEGTILDPTKDIGAGQSSSPYRNRPNVYEATVSDPDPVTQKYVHDRGAGQQQTGWSFVAQLRPKSSAHGAASAGSVLWFAPDDASLSIHIPIYPQINYVPSCLTRDHASSQMFSMNSVFWVNNLVANWVYQNYEVLKPVAKAKQQEMRNYFRASLRQADATAMSLLSRDEKVGKEFLTQMCNVWAEKALTEWRGLFEEMFRVYFDGARHNTIKGKKIPSVDFLPPRSDWYKLIVDETGDRFLWPEEQTSTNGSDTKPKVSKKMRLVL